MPANNATLQRQKEALTAEVEQLRKQLEQQQVIQPVAKEEGADYRDTVVPIVYGPNRQNLQHFQMPLRDALPTLIAYYDAFNVSTNRNVPKKIADSTTGDATAVNQATVYVRMTYRDLGTKQEISVIRDMPLWLAVDNAVQQGKRVELLSEPEFMSWYREQVIRNRKEDNKFRRALEEEEIKLAVSEELKRKAKENHGTTVE